MRAPVETPVTSLKAGLRPAVQQTRAERAVVTAAGDREEHAGRQVVAGGELESLSLPVVRGEVVPLELLHVRRVAGEVSDPAGESDDVGMRLEGRWNGGLALHRRAADRERRRQRRQHEDSPAHVSGSHEYLESIRSEFDHSGSARDESSLGATAR